MKNIVINPCREREKQIKIILPTLLNPRNGSDKIANIKIEKDIGINIESEIIFSENDSSLFSYLHCISDINMKLKDLMGENYTLPLNIENRDKILDFEEDEMIIKYPNKVDKIQFLTKRQLFVNEDIKKQLKNQLRISNLNPDDYQILLNDHQPWDVFMYENNNIPVNIHNSDLAWTVVYRKSLNLTVPYFALLADKNNLEFGFNVRYDDTKCNKYNNKMLIIIYGGHKNNGDF